jgi:hypothetical protein
MKKRFKLILCMALMFLTACSGSAAPDPATLVGGVWVGEWMTEGAENGYLYTLEVTLNINAENEIDGQIVWTFVRSPFEADQALLGLSATEFVRGDFDPATLEVELTGYKEDDPKDIIGPDHYKLFLIEDGTILQGKSENGGAWNGFFTASRKP